MSRDSPLEEAAIAALGANALEHKRAECQKRFMATTRDEQVQLLPEFHAYHVDTDAREAADAKKLLLHLQEMMHNQVNHNKMLLCKSNILQTLPVSKGLGTPSQCF